MINLRARSDRQPATERSPWVVLAVLCTSVFMLLLDTTIVNNAQRKIQLGLGADLTEIQWILDAYILTYAVLLLSFGRMGDIFGRKRLFVIGTVVFTAASGLCGIAGPIGDLVGVSGANALIAARVLQGFGGAMMMPQSLSIITQVFPPEKRGAALGLWGSVVGLGAITGPLLGGFIATNYPWQWVFLINLPVGVAGVFASTRYLPESRDPDASRAIDWGGVLLSGASIFMLVYALIEVNHLGWTSPEIAGLFAASAVTFGAFLWWERRQREPMVRLELFRIHNFAVANVMFMVIAFGMLGIFFPLTIYLQGGLGYSPFAAGLIGAPLSVALMATAPIAGRLSDRMSKRRLILIGVTLVAAGIVALASQVETDTTWPSLMLPMTILGVGMGLTMSPLTSMAMMEVPRGIAGSASGIINTTRSLGQVLGIAVLGTILQSRTGSETASRLDRIDLSSGLRDRVVELAKASEFERIPRVLSGHTDLVPAVMGAIDGAFVDAVRFAFLTSAGMCLIGLLVATLIRAPQTVEASEAAAERPAESRPEVPAVPRVASSVGE